MPQEGSLITYFGNRKSVIDSEYILIDDAGQKYSDATSIYSDLFKIEALRKLEKYKVDYIFFSDVVNKSIGISGISYINDSCFDLVYSRDVKIYKINRELCGLKE